MLNAHARTQRALVRTVELSSIILIEYSREHKARTCISETIRGVIRTKIIKPAFASALLRVVRVLFEARGALVARIIHSSIAAIGLTLWSWNGLK